MVKKILALTLTALLLLTSISSIHAVLAANSGGRNTNTANESSAFQRLTMQPFFNTSEVNPHSTSIVSRSTLRHGLQTIINPDGNVSVFGVYHINNRVYIYEFSASGELLKEVGFAQEFPTSEYTKGVGAFTKDKDGNYYILHGKRVEENERSVVNQVLVKYSPEGVKLNEFRRSAGDEPSNFGGTKVPFSSGTPRLEISGNRIAAYYARDMFRANDGFNHQADTGFILDLNTFEDLTDLNRSERIAMPYVSHSFDQFILPIDNGHFVFASRGDSSPPAFRFFTQGRYIDSFRFSNVSIPSLGGLAKYSST